MKKHLTKISAVLLVLCSLTACSDADAARYENQSSVTDSASSYTESPSLDTDNSSSNTETESSDSTPESKPKTVCYYGEAEIPDIPCGNVDYEGKASTMQDHDALEQCLDVHMIFETHTFGEYTVSLTGDKIRTDKANFSDSIYVQNLRAEVRKNGEKVGEYSDCGYSAYTLYGAQFETEYRLLTDKIGSYLDIYDLEHPVIAMRYFFDDDPRRTVKQAVEFAIIKPDEVYDDLFGICDKGTGVDFNIDHDPNDTSTALMLNQQDGWGCMDCIFAADEFKIADSKTLIDEEAGIRYTFDFISDPYECNGHLYTVEKISET